MQKMKSNRNMKTKIWSRSLYSAIIVIYLVLPTVSSNIFDAIKCESFDTNNEGLSASYLIVNGDIQCDLKSKQYKSLLTFFGLFLPYGQFWYH